jgi:hypothetical protein
LCVVFGTKFVVFLPDYIRFYKDSSHKDFWGEEKYTGLCGIGNWPSAKEPLVIPASSFVVYFHRQGSAQVLSPRSEDTSSHTIVGRVTLCSDGSNNMWGYKMVASERQAEEEDLPPGVPILRRGSSLLSLLAKNARIQLHLMEAMLSDSGSGLRSVVQLLDVGRSDEVTAMNVNAALYSMASNPEMLASILRFVRSQQAGNLTTQVCRHICA